LLLAVAVVEHTAKNITSNHFHGSNKQKIGMNNICHVALTPFKVARLQV
jgi:hypothetical protein